MFLQSLKTKSYEMLTLWYVDYMILKLIVKLRLDSISFSYPCIVYCFLYCRQWPVMSWNDVKLWNNNNNNNEGAKLLSDILKASHLSSRFFPSQGVGAESSPE